MMDQCPICEDCLHFEYDLEFDLIGCKIHGTIDFDDGLCHDFEWS